MPVVDLRDDKQFLIEHPGAVPITTAQVCASFSVFVTPIFELPFTIYLSQFIVCIWRMTIVDGLILFSFLFLKKKKKLLKGEELQKLIGAPLYVECSSKTQQVSTFIFVHSNQFGKAWCGLISYRICVMVK